MSRASLTEIAVVADRSGSMEEIRADAIGGFNSFLADQKKVPGEGRLTLVLFDDEFVVLHSGIDIKTAPNLDESVYVPRGSTALYDAIGRTINEVKARIGQMKEENRPSGVIFAILTDGMENASKEFDKHRVFEMIEAQRKEGWEFTFLAAGQDAFAVGRGLGIKAAATANFVGSDQGVRAAFSGISNYAASYRTASPMARAFYAESSGIQMQNLVDSSMEQDAQTPDMTVEPDKDA